MNLASAFPCARTPGKIPQSLSVSHEAARIPAGTSIKSKMQITKRLCPIMQILGFPGRQADISGIFFPEKIPVRKKYWLTAIAGLDLSKIFLDITHDIWSHHRHNQRQQFLQEIHTTRVLLAGNLWVVSNIVAGRA
jgi:hypothetical protein